MGPPKAANILRESLCRGADKVDPADRPQVRRRRHAGHLGRPPAGDREARDLRPGPGRPPGHRRRHRPGGPADGGEAGHPADHLRGGRPGDRRRPDHRPARPRLRLGDRPLHAAVPADGGRLGQHAAPALGPPPDRAQAGRDRQASTPRSGRSGPSSSPPARSRRTWRPRPQDPGLDGGRHRRRRRRASAWPARRPRSTRSTSWSWRAPRARPSSRPRRPSPRWWRSWSTNTSSGRRP